MNLLQRWWWPVFVFLYPLAFWPKLPNSLLDTFAARVYLTLFFLVGGFVLMLITHPQTRLADVYRIPSFLKQNKVVAIASLYGLWTLLAASLSPNPAIAFTGQLDGYGDGALWTCSMVVVFTLIFLNLRQDAQLVHRILWAVMLSGAVMTLLSLIEVLVGHPLIAHADPNAVPLVSFPQRGHLAGYFVLTLGVALGYWYRGVGRLPGWAITLAIGIGMTYNRAALIAIGTMILLGLRDLRRAGIVFPAILLGIAIGWGTVKYSTPQSVREIRDTSTFFTRLYYWKAAVRGIVARPLTGWGGGVFGYAWPKYMTRAEISKYVQEEWSAGELLSYQYSVGMGQPVFIVRNPQGKVGPVTVRTWKAHNEFLEQALMWGLVGLGLYLALLWYVLIGAFRGEPASVGLLGYHIFLLLWFVFISSQAVLWALLSVAAWSYGRKKLCQPRLAEPELCPSAR